MSGSEGMGAGQWPPQHPGQQGWVPQQAGQQSGPPSSGFWQPQQFGTPAGYVSPGYGPPSYGPSGPAGGPPPKKTRRGLILGLAALFVVAVGGAAIVMFVLPGALVTKTLNVTKAEDGVKSVLTDDTSGYGAKSVKDIRCNDGKNPVVKKGQTFTCAVSVEGAQKTVIATFQDDDGTYEVGPPK